MCVYMGGYASCICTGARVSVQVCVYTSARVPIWVCVRRVSVQVVCLYRCVCVYIGVCVSV